jgi:hypothetical protein
MSLLLLLLLLEHGWSRTSSLMDASRRVALMHAQQQQQVEPWRHHLEESVFAGARYLRVTVKRMRDQARELTTTGAKFQCMRCQQPRFRLDLVDFECPRYRSGAGRCRANLAASGSAGGADEDDGDTPEHHLFCMGCIHQIVKDQERAREGTSAALVLRQALPERSALHVVVCPQCHVPAVVAQSQQFLEGLERDYVDRQYDVHLVATRLLRDNYWIDEVLENQRRPILGTFSSENLLFTDFCGAYADPRTLNEIEDEEMQHRFAKPNPAWVFLEDWTADVAGWEYGSSWQDLREGRGIRAVSFRMFVRSRRMLRTRVRINDEVEEDLRACQFEHQADEM